jgi:alkanesulfonate monooxygenase SsuD/methylene tetrahydromethanopterin reductase-like flavin-dependent oxidoreductase (luciferase family)
LAPKRLWPLEVYCFIDPLTYERRLAEAAQVLRHALPRGRLVGKQDALLGSRKDPVQRPGILLGIGRGKGTAVAAARHDLS